MAAPQVNMRVPAALLARLDAQCERSGMSRTDFALAAIEERLEREEAAEGDAPRRAKAAPKPRAPLPAVIRASELPDAPKPDASAPGSKGRGGAAMEAAGVYVWNGEKRPIYQKGGSAKAKMKR